MRIHAAGSSEVKSWDEKPYSEVDGQPKFTRASVVYAYHGDLEGEGQIEYLMCYPSNDVATFLGYEQVTGRLGDRSGTFVLQHLGTFENGVAKTTTTVVPGSATGALSGLLGEGSGVAHHEPPASFTLDYEFA
ncbi:MAG TPA: DUF3224 domain-containing protein [Ktedonobacteraceae bacterium]|nr:DUF3224 domain-containing protein [Ktedonobacteraceae bacterium]